MVLNTAMPWASIGEWGRESKVVAADTAMRWTASGLTPMVLPTPNWEPKVASHMTMPPTPSAHRAAIRHTESQTVR